MVLLENYLIEQTPKNYSNLSKNIMETIKHLTSSYIFAKAKNLTEKDVMFYFFDDMVVKTNVGFNKQFVVYAEINPSNIIKPAELSKNKIKIKDLDSKVLNTYLSLKEIKLDLFEVYRHYFSSETTIWNDKYSVNLKSKEMINNEELYYTIKIIPCFSYKNENKKQGVIYYSDNLKSIDIDFPKIAIKNIKNKNKLTNGLYIDYVILFKNMFAFAKGIKNYVPYEIIETLIYNVPNEMFVSLTYNNFAQILNHLRNKNFKDMTTIDEQDFVFSSNYKSLSVIYSKHIIKEVEKYFKKISK